jgi:hypothetical protein
LFAALLVFLFWIKSRVQGPARRIPYTPHNGDPQITLASMSRAAEPTSGLTAFNNCG